MKGDTRSLDSHIQTSRRVEAMSVGRLEAFSKLERPASKWGFPKMRGTFLGPP